jgi:hypothetical protein
MTNQIYEDIQLSVSAESIRIFRQFSWFCLSTMEVDAPAAVRYVPTELICLPEDLAHTHLNEASEGAAAPSQLEFEIPTALMHPRVLFDVLSAANVTSVMDTLPDSERQELLVPEVYFECGSD